MPENAGFIPDIRLQIVKWAIWGIDNHVHFTYTEGGGRMDSIGTKPGTLPVHCDCSAWVTLVYYWANGFDPNKLGFDHQGFTGTLLTAGQKITQAQLMVGDVVVLGAYPGKHAAICIGLGADPVFSSMGKQGDPSRARLSQMLFIGPPTFLRYSTKNRDAAPPKPITPPTAAQLKANNLVGLPTPAAEAQAKKNGW